jgi:hypothetical protein
MDGLGISKIELEVQYILPYPNHFPSTKPGAVARRRIINAYVTIYQKKVPVLALVTVHSGLVRVFIAELTVLATKAAELAVKPLPQLAHARLNFIVPLLRFTSWIPVI